MATHLHHRHETAVGVRHWLDWWVWHGLELVELELVFGPDVDVCTLVLRAVAVLGRREDCWKLVSLGEACKILQ